MEGVIEIPERRARGMRNHRIAIGIADLVGLGGSSPFTADRRAIPGDPAAEFVASDVGLVACSPLLTWPPAHGCAAENTRATTPRPIRDRFRGAKG